MKLMEMSTTKKVLIIILAIVVVLCLGIFGSYNGMVNKQENATTAFSNVEAACQRRADLLPNLAKTVKAYAKHENETFKEVAEARSAASQIKIDPTNLTPEKIQQFQKAQGDITTALGKLMAISESYPELKASKNFEDLQAQIEGSENRINYARENYNKAVQDYNITIRKFPNVLFAGMFGFEKMAKFEADKASEKAPELDI